jgi:hypothetical protein
MTMKTKTTTTTRRIINGLASVSMLALLTACGGEPDGPMGEHLLLNTVTGDVVAKFNVEQQAYEPVADFDMSRVVRYALQGQLQVVHTPGGLGDELARPVSGKQVQTVPEPMPIDCRAGQTECGGVCVNLLSDRNNCGTCGLACDGVCTKGACFSRLFN